MNDPTELVLEYFWVLAAVGSLVNPGIWWVRGRPHRERDPSLTAGYLSMTRWLALWSVLPWLIYGVGFLTGGVDSMLQLFRPRDGNPYVLLFHGYAIAVYALGTYWIFFRDGAEKVMRHPGLADGPFINVATLKLLWVAGLTGGILVVGLLFSGWVDVPLPPSA